MNIRSGTPGFPPICAPNSRALILGSYPSPKSFAAGFYYGHPQNRFWSLIALLANAEIPTTIEEKTALILRHNLALWDSLQQCTIAGASDASITQAVPNDIAGLVQHSQIQAIFCNGSAAHTYYSRYCARQTGLTAMRLPSTSPANAAWGLARLAEAWQPVREYMR